MAKFPPHAGPLDGARFARKDGSEQKLVLPPIDEEAPGLFPFHPMNMTFFKRGGTWSLPNILTYGRLVAVPVVVSLLFWPDLHWVRWTALGIFAAAAITDFFDGYLARAWEQQSSLGRMLDPIADKLLVASCLLMLTAIQTINSWSIWAAIVILCREMLVSGLREYLAELRVSLPVTRVAKYKGFSSPGRPVKPCCPARK